MNLESIFTKLSQRKQYILLHDFTSFDVVTIKKMTNIYNKNSCVERRLVRKPCMSQDHIRRR